MQREKMEYDVVIVGAGPAGVGSGPVGFGGGVPSDSRHLRRLIFQ